MTSRWRCGAKARRSKPQWFWPRDASRGPPMAGRPGGLIGRRRSRLPGPKRWRVTAPEMGLNVTNGPPPGTLRSKPSNTARGTPWDLADLRHYRFRQASMSRGVEARGSIRTLGVPRALGSFEAGGRRQTTAYSAPQIIGAAERWLMRHEIDYSLYTRGLLKQLQAV